MQRLTYPTYFWPQPVPHTNTGRLFDDTTVSPLPKANAWTTAGLQDEDALGPKPTYMQLSVGHTTESSADSHQ